MSGSTVFYGPAAGSSGGFTVTATSTGATSVQFPTVFGGDSANDTSSPYTASYAWTSAATASASYAVTASNSSGPSTPTSFNVTRDINAPSSSAGCNSGADCSGSYSGSVTVKLTASDSSSGVNKIYYTTDGVTDPTTSSPSVNNNGTFTTPAGSTIKYRATDNVGNLETTHTQILSAGSVPPAPSLTLQASDANDFVSGSTVFYGPAAGSSGGFTVTATSTGATSVQFPTVFGGDSANDTSSPYTASYAWTSAATASASYAVTASNSSGPSTPTSFNVTRDINTPSSSAGCNSGADCSGSYSGSVTVKLSASDSSSGVNKIYYTTDGVTDPTTSSPSVNNNGTFTTPAGSTIKYRATDNVGNLETTHTTTIAGSVPAAPSLSLQANDSVDYVSGSTVFYNPGAATFGSFVVTATGDASVTSVDFPTIFGLDRRQRPHKPYQITYNWSAAATADGPYQVTANNTVGASPPASFTVSQDITAPSSSAGCNSGADCSGSYNGSVTVKLSATDSGRTHKIYYTTDGVTDPTTSSPSVNNNGTFTTPAGSTIKYRATDNVGNLETTHTTTIAGSVPAAPSLSLQANDSVDYVSGSTVFYNPGAATFGSFVVTATGDASVTSVDFPTIFGLDGGNDPTSPYQTTYTWSAAATADGPYQVTANNTIGASPPASFTVTQDLTAPSSSAGCNGGADCSGSYSGSVTVKLSASDSSSGVNKIYYTTDGVTDPTTSSPSVNNNGTFTTPAGSTIKYRATDNVGNLETTHTTTIAGSVPAAPSLSLQANDTVDYVSGSTVYYNPGAAFGSFDVTATGDASVTSVDFPTIFGADGGNDGTAPYTVTYNWNGTATADGPYQVTANNTIGASPPASFTVTQDLTAPSSSAGCNSGADCSGSYSGSVTVKLTASDSSSGVNKIYYTTDGVTDPTTSSPSVNNNGTFTTPAGSTIKYRATDNVGNLETTHTQILSAGSVPPAPSLTLQASDANDFVSGSNGVLSAGRRLERRLHRHRDLDRCDFGAVPDRLRWRLRQRHFEPVHGELCLDECCDCVCVLRGHRQQLLRPLHPDQLQRHTRHQHAFLERRLQQRR